MSTRPTKTFNSVESRLRETAVPDEAIGSIDEFETRINSRKLIKELIAIRARNGMSQADLAEVMVCSQSRVSKLENGCDDDLSLGEARKYMSCVGFEMIIGGKPKGGTLVDEIKAMAMGIKRKLEELAECASNDESIAAGIASFYAEAFFNFYKMLKDNAERLPSRPEDDKPYITFGLSETDEPSPEITQPSFHARVKAKSTAIT